jgi:hypothetical protein
MFAATTFALLAAAAPAQDPPASPLDAVVLRQEGEEFRARAVLARVAASDPTLLPALESDAEYLRLYLDSPIFLEHVRAFSDERMLDAEGLAAAAPEALQAEALAWAADRGLPADAGAALARAGIEISNRARMLADQPDEFGSNMLRQHMLRSVPEFFGSLQISWIRVPLFDPADGTILGEDARRALWERLDAAGRAVQAGETEWEAAVEEHSQDPVTRGRGGRLGIVHRGMTDRLEEGFLRQLFADLGFRQPEGMLLRGPILTSRWAYLVRIEAVVVAGIVDLERVRPRVERSLHESLLQAHLAELAAGTVRHILLPLPR